MKPIRLIAALFCALAFVAAPLAAFAADALSAAPSVNFDLGAILSPLLSIAGAALATVAAWALTKLPPFVQALLTEQLLKRAVDYAVATVAGAVAGKEVTIPIANDLIRAAAQYAADNAPKLTAKLGETLGPKIIARLGDAIVLPANATGSNLTQTPAPVLPR